MALILRFDQRGLRKPEVFPVLILAPLSVEGIPQTQAMTNLALLPDQVAGALLVLQTSKPDLGLYQHRAM